MCFIQKFEETEKLHPAFLGFHSKTATGKPVFNSKPTPFKIAYSAKKTHRTLQDYFHPIAFIEHLRKIDPFLYFPGTDVKYMRPEMKVEDAISKFNEKVGKTLRLDFKKKIREVIRQMHQIGFVFGVTLTERDNKWSQTARSFEVQSGIMDRSKASIDGGGNMITSAGPGETWHHYGYA
ncbi:hypothetical protein KKA14_07270, partial [bacterium]|nr:hypothetical protein [bacterium]